MRDASGSRCARRAAVVFSFFGCACGAGSARFATTDPSLPPAPRRPPGIVITVAPRLPPPQSSGATASRLLVLASPPGDAAVRQVVARFFDALLEESADALDGVLASQAWLDGSSGRQPAKATLRARFTQLEYGALRGVTLYRPSELEIYASDAAHTLEPRRAVPGDLPDGDVFVRAHLSVSHAGKARLFSDQMTFALRATGDGLRITRIGENTAVP